MPQDRTADTFSSPESSLPCGDISTQGTHGFTLLTGDDPPDKRAPPERCWSIRPGIKPTILSSTGQRATIRATEVRALKIGAGINEKLRPESSCTTWAP